MYRLFVKLCFASLISQNIFCRLDKFDFLRCSFPGLSLGLALLAAWFPAVAWKLCWCGYRSCRSCCWAWIALSAAKFFSFCLIITTDSSAWAQPLIWSRAASGILCRTVYEASVCTVNVGTHRVLCVFPEDV